MKTSNTKSPGIFKYISLGDVHLGHRSSPTASIIKNLDRLISNELLKTLDMVIITGDLFDRQLSNGDDVLHQINRWITLFMMRCAANNVMIRIVEGTPSHDRLQSQFFVEQKINANIPVDLFYSKKLAIEYIEKLDAYFLYIPDKWNPSPTVTLSMVKSEMAALGIDKVDFAIMHGAFSYQLPSIVEEPTHDENEYLAIVKNQILIGHVHNMTIRDRIFAAGSFDRICHNDEIPKGMFEFKVKESGDYTAKFIENKNAKIYKTLDVHGLDTKQLINKIKETLIDLPNNSAIRLRCDPLDVATGDIDSFRQQYPHIEWTCVVETKTNKKNTVIESLKRFDMKKFLDITKDSILDIIVEDLDKYTKNSTIKQQCLNLLKEHI